MDGGPQELQRILLHRANPKVGMLGSIAELVSEEFQKPQPLLVSKKVRQYTSNLYGSRPPICIVGPSWLLSLEERGSPTVHLPFVLQYASHLYRSSFEKILGVGVTGKFLIVGRFGYILYFFSVRGGEREVEASEQVWGVSVVIENGGRGYPRRKPGGRDTGAARISARRGGGKFFFFGPEIPAKRGYQSMNACSCFSSVRELREWLLWEVMLMPCVCSVHSIL